MLSRKVYFVIANSWTGTGYGRGVMVNKYLSDKGYDTECLEGYNHDWSSIKDSIVVFVKHHNPEAVVKLRSQNNIVVLDVLDGYVKTNIGAEKSRIAKKGIAPFIEDYFDSYILSTKRLLEDTKDLYPSHAIPYVIYEKFDPKVAKYKEIFDRKMPPHNRLKIGYIGAVENMMYHNNDVVNKEVSAVFDFKQQPKMAPLFNCHYSIRREGTEDFLYKPTSKITTAAAVGANIIHTRDCCAVEIAGEDYPYYTDSDIDSVINTIQFAKETYGSKIWKDGLSIIADVRERLHIDRICGKDYIDFFRMLCE